MNALTDCSALEWRPIETMPDRTEVLVWVADRFMQGVKFGSGYRLGDGQLIAKPSGCNGGPWNITHWMPLPAPPSSAKLTVDDASGMNP